MKGPLGRRAVIPAVFPMIEILLLFAIPRITLLIMSVRSTCWNGMLDSWSDPEDVLIDYQYSSAEYGDAKTPCRRSRHPPHEGGKERMGQEIAGVIIVILFCLLAWWYINNDG